MATTRRRDERAGRTSPGGEGGPFDPVLLDLLEEGVVVHGLDGAVVSWNAAAGRILGIPPARLGGSLTLLPGLGAMREDGQSLDLQDEPAHVALRTGEPCRARTARFRRGDGGMAWLELSAAPLPSRGPRHQRGALTVIVDVTERRSAEQQVRGAHRMEAIGRLAGAVAHDFNNLLTAILGYNEILLRGLGASDPRRSEAEQVRLAAQRASGLTRQLLAFSRQQVLEMRVLDLKQVLSDMLPMLRRLVGEDLRLRLDAGARSGSVRADRTQLEQIVLNLVINARDAMPAGGSIRVACAEAELDQAFVDAHPGSRAGHHVVLSVEDDGCGMDEQTQAHIFEPFFTTKTADRGTGLGLATVYGIVKQSAGYIGVESAPGRGTTFRVYLPRCTDTAIPRSAVPRPTAVARASGTILLVEDDDLVRGLIRRMLETQGYAVVEESDGSRALELLERHPEPIAALVTDVVMPGLRGPEVARRAAKLRPRLPVLYLSGHADSESGAIGDAHFLAKPFRAETLAAKLQEILAAAGATEDSSRGGPGGGTPWS